MQIIHNSLSFKMIIRLNETIERLEQRCEEATKQYEDVKHLLEQERRKHERVQESHNNNYNSTSYNISCIVNENSTKGACKESAIDKESTKRHHSASEPESDEVSFIFFLLSFLD
jgi:hypothetical protein